ncbi:Xaa-Pro peptidase family protein [Geomonas nitrogeniifigens]|uniref:Xaa-Pro peptidase family protein n=1 Tax=Geomonas diazotrophica TaxID=2843197 RepID=A0ABX8JCK0_9BACT|nr:Xaa-Pro peptidase family protein [Geomonas nitrogeniifigens]QWV96139.1 Xaa-Pro peptidase family protein [Geomonas nitrogeniifigens]QXE85206.1 Xaa-Pro peptidase family protein [Geomonas nitrogeniifigens]
MLTRTESEQRIARLQDGLKEKGVDAALFIYPIDIYYFSGTRQNSVLFVPAEGKPRLMVRKSYFRAQGESVIDDTRPFPSSKEFPSLFPPQVKRIGFTFDVAPVQQYQYYARLLPGVEFVDISSLNRELRSVKSKLELERMRESGTRLCGVFKEIPGFLKEGMRELDLAAEFEYRLRKAGGEGYVRMRAYNQELFQGLAVSSGAGNPGFFDGAVTGRGLSNASPHGASTDTIQANVPVLVDYTGVFNGYIVDMTRMFVVGRLAPELERAFATSLQIQQHLAENLKPGAVCEELFAQAAGIAESAGLARNFMGAPGENAKFVGHGVGLELDEFPVLAQGFKSPLQEGQTVAIEPKFVLPGLGVVGIENTFAVAREGGVKLTDLADDIVCV